MNLEWHGYLDPDDLKPDVVVAGHALADAAKVGDWPRTLELARTHRLGPNAWRPGGSSWFTPLHQAAHLGAPLDVVVELLRLGAWRRLPTADGRLPADLARDGGHQHLDGVLAPPREARPVAPDVEAALDRHLAEVVEGRIRPHLTARLRHPVTAVAAECPDQRLWYPVPGMYGGFSIARREHHLYVESWSRVAGGSGQAHVVTIAGAELVDSGFV